MAAAGSPSTVPRIWVPQKSLPLNSSGYGHFCSIMKTAARTARARVRRFVYPHDGAELRQFAVGETVVLDGARARPCADGAVVGNAFVNFVAERVKQEIARRHHAAGRDHGPDVVARRTLLRPDDQ